MAIAEEVREQAEPGAARTRRARPSARLTGRRLLAAIPVLWGVTFLTYVVMNLLPGDAAQELLGANATPAQVHQLEIQLHLNEPFWVRYGGWLGALLHGDLGTSLASRENVTTILGQRLPVTAELLIYAFAGSIVFAVYTRLLRADIVEQMQREDYIVTARAKGVSPWRVLIRHALPNSLFGLITLVALNLGTLVGAVAIIEPIFSLPGVGAILIQSITDHDVPVVEGIVVVFAVVVVLAGLLADLLYATLDPRIRYERAAS